MKLYNTSLTFSTKGEVDFIDLTKKIEEAISKSGMKNGLVHVFAPHATGIITLTENDWSLLQDVKDTLDKLLPRGRYKHPINAHSHLRSVFLSPCKTIPLVNGNLALGTWQNIIFIEADVSPRQRTIIIQIIGE
ncbi:secondary thiamine-phosphate synthase enzyme YjbQ [Candidatus Bathyarchaeota archaeon]|nr:secondary thiamine-phosphate synthase enzyme YjbQ [Candidatus Bathyarchaeota archaeon]